MEHSLRVSPAISRAPTLQRLSGTGAVGVSKVRSPQRYRRSPYFRFGSTSALKLGRVKVRSPRRSRRPPQFRSVPSSAFTNRRTSQVLGDGRQCWDCWQASECAQLASAHDFRRVLLPPGGAAPGSAGEPALCSSWEERCAPARNGRCSTTAPGAVLFKGKTSLRQLYVKPLRFDPSARNRLPTVFLAPSVRC